MVDDAGAGLGRRRRIQQASTVENPSTGPGWAVTAAGDALDEVGDIAEGAVDTGGKVLPWNW